MTAHATIELFAAEDTHAVDAVTACALRHALRPDLSASAAIDALVAKARADEHLLTAALGRVDRSLVREWSTVVARADETLRAARERVRSAS